MGIDDELQKSETLAEIADEADRSIQKMLLSSGIAGLISRIPCGVGSAINQMLTELAFRRTHQRMRDMVEEMIMQIQNLGERINTDRFMTEEFQTLFFEAVHQLHVSHEKQKVRMLGAALANSGADEFSQDDRKQLFVQLIRDLTTRHVAMLKAMQPKDGTPDSQVPSEIAWRRRPNVKRGGTDLLVLQMLAANGLVEESLEGPSISKPSISSNISAAEAQRLLARHLRELEKPPTRSFRLSELGRDFLQFVGSGTQTD